MLSQGGLGAGIGAPETARAQIIVTAAAIIAVFQTDGARWRCPCWLARRSVVAVPVTGGAGQGPNHDSPATSTAIVFRSPSRCGPACGWSPRWPRRSPWCVVASASRASARRHGRDYSGIALVVLRVGLPEI